MTTPIPHGEAVRNAVRVEWMRLGTYADMCAAGDWAETHGLRAIATSRALRVYGQGAELSAYLGQVLAFNPASGEFTVWEPEHFQAAHSEVAGVQG